ncbi:rab11 family-interacting protein 5 isoform X2 [Willisornis vidua]|uniref:Rab11 family-interacting protein 5 isoform X2 n=1 Tax=Willisornis vidua TaxID=1566151 RepID=A0ABQ9DT15_9PASS|nr:rab11 family-interacting protein 5 isoform X2 [Willisornis vidua]
MEASKLVNMANISFWSCDQAGEFHQPAVGMWHKLHSKAGKKEKERGEILVSIQFTRNNLTASMFDLSMKDKPRSPFGKLKDKVTGKKKYDLESASAIIPSSLGALDGEDDYEMGGKKAKVKGFFLKNKLRKSSLTQSNTSLGSDSTISSASLSLAANAPEVTKSPSRHSSLSTERSVKDYLPSPKLTHKRAFSDDVSQVSPVLEPKAIQSLNPKNDPVSRSSLCINGSHVYSDEPTPKSPALVPPSSAPLPVPTVPRRQEEAFGFAPLHPDSHEVPWGVGSFERSQQRDEPRFIPSPPSLALQEELKVSTKAVTLSNHLGRARMEENSRLENKPTQAAAPMVFSSDTTKDKQPEETRKEEKKPKGGFFHHGGSRSDVGSKGQVEKGGPSVPGAAAGDERSKSSGWFGSKEPKDSPQKPRALCWEWEEEEEKEKEEEEGDLPPPPPPPDTEPAVPPPLSEWDDTFDAFATSRLKPEGKKENFFASLAAEGMAFIDDADAASPTERAAKPAHEEGTKGFEKDDLQLGGEIPAALRSWTNFSSLDVGANLVSTTQEATVIEDVLSPVSAGAMGRRRKSSTPTVWTAAFASGNTAEKEASTALTAGNSTREGGDSGEEESSSAGTNGWMTIATETAPEPSESTQGVAEERRGQDSVFSPRPAFLGDGAFEATGASCAAAHVLPRGAFPPELTPEALPGSNVVAVPPRVLARPFPAPPEPGTEPQGAGSEGDAFDIRTSVYRLQASMRLEAGEGLVKLSSDIRERHVVLSPWAGPQEREDMVAVPPPKPPRWFAATDVGGDGEEEEEEEARGPQQGSEERGEDTEGPKADVELPRSHVSNEPSVPPCPSPPALGVDTSGAGSDFPVSKDAEHVDLPADLEARASELGKGDISLGEGPSEMDEMDVAEQFETCASKFSLDGSGQSGAEQSWNQSRLSPQTEATDSAKWEVASKEELFPEELSISGLNPPSKLGQPEMFWTALEEQESAGHPTGPSPRLAHGESPPQPELAWDDGEGQEGHQPEPCAPGSVASPPQEVEQGRPPPEGLWHLADRRIDFKKADFWKPDRAEERHKQEVSAPRNPFTLALSPNSPSNPFMDTPPAPLPTQAVLPEKLEQGNLSLANLHEEALLGHGFQPTNPLVQPPSLHASQPLASSTPFLVAATNPQQSGLPCRAAGSAVPAASSRAAAQPCPWPQPGDTQASALGVLPRETQPAEKPLCQQTTRFPLVMKQVGFSLEDNGNGGTVVERRGCSSSQEVSSEKKQQHRSSLTTALSNGLERLKTVTTSSVQPVAPSSHPEKTEPKKLKDPTMLDQSAKYYHLTHDELIQLLLQREMELSKKEEHIQELENYIDQLLVRIMEQSPTLLQIPLGESKPK